jgi:DNA-binding NarL/FixJ family response regulator
VAARAHHVELSARQGDAEAVAVLRAAGQAAAQRAPTTAARWFEGALRLLPAEAVEEGVELLLARAGALAATGRFAESHAALLDSLRIVPGDAVALRVRLVVKCAAVENQLGLVAPARSRLERTLEELDDRDSPEAAALMVELAISALFQGEFEQMARWADGAIATAEPLSNQTLTATALAVEAAGAAMAASPAVGTAKRNEAARLVDTFSDEELASGLAAAGYLALAEMYLDHFEDSMRHAARALEVSRATGQGDLLALIIANLGPGLWVRGRTAEACEVLGDAVEAARLMDNAQSLCWTLFNYAYGLVAAGEIELALATAQESHELALALDPGPITGHAGSAYALALYESGEPARAADVLVSAAGGDELRMIGGAWRARNLELLTRCHLGAGSRADAERAAEAARACADEVGLPMARAMAELSAAALELDGGGAASSARRARAAVEELESVGDAFDAARARVVAGRALGRTGDTAAATVELEQAAAAFAAFGSPRHQAEAEQELRRLGRPVYRRSVGGTAPGGVAALTERELQLARLVVDRKTNPQIAAELFLSQKTVETHLRNIFRKVGVSSRVELARAVERADDAEGEGR